MITYLIVNFGGPRSLKEIEPFLTSLLTDRDVVRTRLPQVFHNVLFKKIARKRTVKIAHDYEEIGGGSPIFQDTEYVAQKLQERLQAPVLTFHRYLPDTHAESIKAMEKIHGKEVRVFPMFPQFTYATTGSIARFFADHLPQRVLNKLHWVKSYPTHPAFVNVTQQAIREYLQANDLKEEETILLFSAHGVPRIFVDEGDPYEYECHASFTKVMKAFPEAMGRLAYQSKFGPGEWLLPETQRVCEDLELWNDGRKNVVFVPISFTSDHIETLFEIEKLYMPLVEERGLKAYRVPAFNRRPEWIEAIATILEDYTPVATEMLVRKA